MFSHCAAQVGTRGGYTVATVLAVSSPCGVVGTRVSRISGLYAIYDHPYPFPLSPEEVVRAMLADGVGARVIQLRAKRATHLECLDLACRLGPICAQADVPLVVNDDLRVATAGIEGVSGLHLGQRDLARVELASLRTRLHEAGLLLGLSTHNLHQLGRASTAAPDYVAYGPVFPTRTKRCPGAVVGLASLAAACRCARVPVVAIGGIDVSGAEQCVARCAQSIAVVGALVAANPGKIRRQALRLARCFGEAVKR